MEIAIYLLIGAILARITEKHQHELGGARPTDDEDQRGQNVLTWWIVMLSMWPLILAVYVWAKVYDRFKGRPTR